MQTLRALIVVNVMFVALNILGAGILLILFKAGAWLVPSLMDEAMFLIPLGLSGIALMLWLYVMAWRFMVRSPWKDRARGRG